MEIYKSDGISIYDRKTQKGIDYLEYGNVGDPLIVYLHGIGEVGKTPYSLLLQSPVCAGWNPKLGQWGEMEGFKYPDFFTKGIRVVAPILKSGSWTPAYINSFLDEINNTNLTCLMGWSWGGEGTANYLNQSVKKYSFKCGVIMCKSGGASGTNVSCPIKMVHATNDGKTSVNNSDTFYNGVPSQFKAGYDRPSSGDHWVWQNFLEPSTGIYEWIKSMAEPSQEDEIIPDPQITWNKTKGLLIIEGVTYKLTEQ